MICIAKEHLNKKNMINTFCDGVLSKDHIPFDIKETGISISLYVNEHDSSYVKKEFNFFYEKSEESVVIDGNFAEIHTEITKEKYNLFTACGLAFFTLIFIMQSYVGEDLMNLLFYHHEFGASFIVEPWRYITPAIMHGSMIHLFMNMLCWNQLSGALEKHYDYKLVLSVVLFTAFISNAAQFIFSGPNFLGISGAIFGLIGYIWAKGKLDTESRVGFNNSVLWFSLGWIGLGYLNIIPGVQFANEAHLFGLLSGIAYAVLEARKKLR